METLKNIYIIIVTRTEYNIRIIMLHIKINWKYTYMEAFLFMISVTSFTAISMLKRSLFLTHCNI